jgi:ribosomal-protein-alanine N-acetyltransferase
MSEPVRMRTPRMIIRLLDIHEAPLLLRYRIDNREHLKPWEPRRSETHYTIEGCRQAIEAAMDAARSDRTYAFFMLPHDGSEVIGSFSFSNVVRGVFEAAHLGYGLGERYQGDGWMAEALQAGIRYAFGPLDLHRLMANYMPRNERSGRLLERLGFEKEGLARQYLKIDGRWEDHVLTSRVRPEP